MASYKAEIKQIPEHIVYYKDYYASSISDFLNLSKEDNFLQDLSDRVMAENPQIHLTEPDYNVLLYLDGDFREQNIHYRFCDAVTGFGRDGQDYKFARIEGFTAVSVLHKGPYRRLGEAYKFVKKWMEDCGYIQSGPPRDSAIDGCWNRESEEDYLTEIQIPVVQKTKERSQR